jgi:acyl carrier protein
MNHLRLVSAVEEEFQIKLSMQEIESIRSLAVLRALVEQHTS